jgi:hypothetical protein
MYDDLTVKRISLFGGIYGLSRVKIKEKRAQLVSELGLENAVDKLVGDLPLAGSRNYPFQWLYYTNLNCISRRTNWWRRSHYEKTILGNDLCRSP